MTGPERRPGPAGDLTGARGQPRRLLVLHDSPAFGGHELMFLDLLPTLLAAPDFDEIHLVFPEANDRFADSLKPFVGDRLVLLRWSYAKRPAEPWRGPFRFAYRRAVRRLADRLRPAAALLIQGRVENCVVPTLALPRDLFLVSYVPMAHRLSDMGRSGIGDLVRRRLYRRPDRFLVPSTAVAEQLRRAGARGPAVVVQNRVSPPPPAPMAEARAGLDLPPDRKLALFLGRLDVRQKGLDLLCDAIRRAAPRLGGWTFLFVGDGEGREMIESLVGQLAPAVDVRLHGWTDAPHLYLAATDVLLMPSRWEGVPLVMLEAITYRRPLLTSGIDVFEEYLPDYCRIDFVRDDLAAALDRLADPATRAAFADAVGSVEAIDLDARAAALLGAFRPA